MSNSLLRMIALMGVAAGMAQAQVAPPPPAEKPAEPKYTPPAQQAPAQPQARPAPKPGEAPQASRLKDLPTDIPYPKLAQRDENGKVIRLNELPDILALRANPTVGEKSVDDIMPVIYGRRARFEMLVIENLDLYWQLTAGAITNLDMNNLQELSRVAEMVKPLVGKNTLSEELQSRGILSRTQGGMNEYIVQEYKQAIANEIEASQGQDGMTEFMKFILEDSIHEARLAYQGMLVEAKSKASELLAKTGIENEKVAALGGMISSDPDVVEQEVAEFDAAVRTMSVDDAIRFFTAMREGRENPNFSPTVQRVVVMHNLKVNYEGGMQRRDIKGNEPIFQGQKKPAEQPEGDN